MSKKHKSKNNTNLKSKICLPQNGVVKEESNASFNLAAEIWNVIELWRTLDEHLRRCQPFTFMKCQTSKAEKLLMKSSPHFRSCAVKTRSHCEKTNANAIPHINGFLAISMKSCYWEFFLFLAFIFALYELSLTCKRWEEDNYIYFYLLRERQHRYEISKLCVVQAVRSIFSVCIINIRSNTTNQIKRLIP